jgi:hypothetical protein
MNLCIGSNLIKNQNFRYEYVVPSYIRDGINKDYHITNYNTLSPNIGLAYSRLINNSRKCSYYFEVESALYLNTEKFLARGNEESFYGKNEVEFTVVNYYSGYNISLNFSFLKNLISSKTGIFIGAGAGSLVYGKTIKKGINYTTNEKLDSSGEEIMYENIQLNINFGFEYRYKIRNSKLCSRLLMSPQISKDKLMSYKFFAFNNRNYLVTFSTAIVL